jgi:hypothetical protein
VPPGKQWVSGYWREEGEQWQWVPGFWSQASKGEEQQVAYLPEPPKAPAAAAPGPKPAPEAFYVPGHWEWTGETYAWRAGYWARIQPGYVWVNDHFRWTPSGYVYIPGYWDLALKNRGMLYAPVIISPSVVTVGFVYTPCYAVRDTVVVDAMFVRPTTCHYYFGDYYEVRYRSMGYESCVVYSQRNYDSIVVYETYERRSDPTWLSLQINIFNNRASGLAPCPPRTLVAQQQIINNTTVINNVTNVTNVTNINNTTNVKNVTNISMIAPPSQVAAAKGAKLATIDQTTRMAAREQANVMRQVAAQRVANERPLLPGAARKARMASLNVPKPQPVKRGMVVPKAPTRSPSATARVNTPANSTRPGQNPATLGAPKSPAASTGRLGSTTPPPGGSLNQPKPGTNSSPGLRPPPPPSRTTTATNNTRPGTTPPYGRTTQPARTPPGKTPPGKTPPGRTPPPKTPPAKTPPAKTPPGAPPGTQPQTQPNRQTPPNGATNDYRQP